MQEIYDKIAPGWYNFRHRSIYTRELEALAARWQSGRLLNVGCAHGPDFPPFAKNFELYGVDFSTKMLELGQKYAAKYGFTAKTQKADARSLPFDNEFFDYVITVAVIHHIEGEGERLKALREIYRVLKPGGEAFVTAWNKGQPRFRFRKKDITVPWRSGEETLQRYYHLFTYGELKKLLVAAGFEIIKMFPESSHRFPIKAFSRNICALVRKGGGRGE